MEANDLAKKLSNCSEQLEKESSFGSWLTEFNDVKITDYNEQSMTIGGVTKYYATAVISNEAGKKVGELALGSFMGQVFVGTLTEAQESIAKIGGDKPTYKDGFVLKTNTTLIKKVGKLKDQLLTMLDQPLNFVKLDGFSADFNCKTLASCKGSLKVKTFFGQAV